MQKQMPKFRANFPGFLYFAPIILSGIVWTRFIKNHLLKFLCSTIWHAWFRSKIDFKKLFTVLLKWSFFGSNDYLFQKLESLLQVYRAKEKSPHNPGHNTLELYNVLVQVWFVTSKSELDVLCKKPFVRVASLLPNDLRLRILKNKQILEKPERWLLK